MISLVYNNNQLLIRLKIGVSLLNLFQKQLLLQEELQFKKGVISLKFTILNLLQISKFFRGISLVNLVI